MKKEKDIVTEDEKVLDRNEAIQAEYSKIVWPTAKTVCSNTLTVIIIGAILAVIIFFIDMALRGGISLFVG